MSSALLNILPESQHVSATERLLTPKTLAIPLLNSDLARYYSYAHTAQILVYYYFRAGALVANPLPTLLEDAFPLAMSQALFCAICLPSVGNWNSGTDASEMIKGSASAGTKIQKTTSAALPTPKKKATGKISLAEQNKNIGGSWSSRILPTILALILSVIMPTIPLMILALVLGAPLYPTSLLPHTLMLSLHVSLFGTLPIFYTHGVNAAAWRDVSAAWLPFDEAGIWGGTVGVMVGGWFGAVPIALDWDREWQKWPCTVLWGAVLGWAAGRLMTNGFKLGIGRRIDLSVTEYTPPAEIAADPATSSQKKKI